MFGLGWLRDAVRMSEYLDDANGEKFFEQRFKDTLKNKLQPDLHLQAMLAAYVFGGWW